MSIIDISCPNTGEFISTGIEIDIESFNKLPDVLTHSRCPHCGLDHSWWTREARLVNATPAKATPNPSSQKVA
jgi:hypothetical protein